MKYFVALMIVAVSTPVQAGTTCRVESATNMIVITTESIAPSDDIGMVEFLIVMKDVHSQSHAFVKASAIDSSKGSAGKDTSLIPNQALRDIFKAKSGWLLNVQIYRKSNESDGKYRLIEDFLLKHNY